MAFAKIEWKGKVSIFKPLTTVSEISMENMSEY